MPPAEKMPCSAMCRGALSKPNQSCTESGRRSRMPFSSSTPLAAWAVTGTASIETAITAESARAVNLRCIVIIDRSFSVLFRAMVPVCNFIVTQNDTAQKYRLVRLLLPGGLYSGRKTAGPQRRLDAAGLPLQRKRYMEDACVKHERNGPVSCGSIAARAHHPEDAWRLSGERLWESSWAKMPPVQRGRPRCRHLPPAPPPG